MTRGAVLVSAVLVAGCISNRLPEPQVTVPSAFQAPQAPGVSSMLLDRWWLAFGDTQLTGLIDQALGSAPDARTALARLREAQGVRRGALTSYDPQGNVSSGISRSDTTIAGAPATQTALLGAGPSLSTNAGLSVSWEIDMFGRRAAARQSAEADLAAAQFDYHATRLALAANVATQLVQARGLASQIVEGTETLRIAQDLAHVGRLRVTAGIGSEADAARLDTELANAQSDLANLKAQLVIAQRTLLVLLGRGTQTIDSLPIAADLPTPPRPPVLTPGDVMQRRPDVAEAEARLRSAAGTLRLNQLALFPKLTLQPGASYTRLIDPLAYGQSVWSVAAGLFVPVLDRPRLLSQIGAQTARGEQAVITYEHTVQTAYGEAENSLTRLSSDLERLDRLTYAEQRASFAFSAQQQGYKAGVIDLNTLLQTEQSWRGARIALVALRTAALADAVTAFKALGGGWTPLPPAGN